MADIVDKKTRSRMMAGIRGTHTKPELAVRKALFRAGLRYRLHPRNLPGRPDIALPSRRSVVLVHGCFWHRHPGCRFAYTPKSNVPFWVAKFASNVRRDKATKASLRKAGWRVFTIWECEVHDALLNRLVRDLKGRRRTR
jgi:DNA mismatch endonuclease (patch repair protein)